jgi:hypothetical protein
LKRQAKFQATDLAKVGQIGQDVSDPLTHAASEHCHTARDTQVSYLHARLLADRLIDAMKGSAFLSGKSTRGAGSEMSRGRMSIDNALGTFRLHLHSSTVLDDEVTNAFDPNSKGVKIWDQALLVGFLFEVFLLPLVLAFKLDSLNEAFFATIVEGSSELLFLFDVYVKAHTGFYSDGNLMRDRRRTRRRYFHSFGFVLDVVALIPFASFPTLTADQRNQLNLIKLVRVYRMVRFVAALDEFYTAHFVVVKLLKVIVGTVLLSHVIACVRIVFGYNHDGTNEWLPEEFDPEHGGDSVRGRYLQALFWGFGVLTGLFEGELPHSIAQFLFTIFVACCGFFVFVTLCATIFVISKCESGNTEAVEARINQLVHLLSYHHVPENVQAPAIEYLRVRRSFTCASSSTLSFVIADHVDCVPLPSDTTRTPSRTTAKPSSCFVHRSQRIFRWSFSNQPSRVSPCLKAAQSSSSSHSRVCLRP